MDRDALMLGIGALIGSIATALADSALAAIALCAVGGFLAGVCIVLVDHFRRPA